MPEDGCAGNGGAQSRARGVAVGCACDPEKLRIVHAYLREQFPGDVLRDHHPRGSAREAGRRPSSADAHLIRIGHDQRVYSVVLTDEFLEHAADRLDEHLRRFALAEAVRTYRIAVVWRTEASSLRPSGPEHG